MFGIGLPELLLIMALALIVVGPDKLPDLARTIAKTIVDLKKTAEGLKESIDTEINPLSDIKPELEDAAKKFKENVLDVNTEEWKPNGEKTPLDELDSATKDLLTQSHHDEEKTSEEAYASKSSDPASTQEDNPATDKKPKHSS